MTEVMQLFVDRIETPIAKMLIAADRDGNLGAVDWVDHEAVRRM